jgi:dolichol-phosphate mannosyltransferase
LVFIPTYNEAGNIDFMVNKVFAHHSDCDLLIVDDGSPDGTAERVEALAKTHERGSRLRLIRRSGKMGIGSAHRLAMMVALEAGYEFLITMDGDGSHEPESLPQFMEMLKDHDFVIGSRFLAGSLNEYQGYRKVLSQGANSLLNFALGMNSTEFTTAYRAFRCDWLATFPFARIHGQGYNFFFQCLYWVRRYGARYGELPIQFHNRREGESKIDAKEICLGVLFLLKIIAIHLLGKPLPPGERVKGAACKSCGSPYLERRFSGQVTCLVCHH